MSVVLSLMTIRLTDVDVYVTWCAFDDSMSYLARLSVVPTRSVGVQENSGAYAVGLIALVVALSFV